MVTSKQDITECKQNRAPCLSTPIQSLKLQSENQN